MNLRLVAKIEAEEPTLRLAVLIDADNAQAAVIEGFIGEIARFVGDQLVRVSLEPIGSGKKAKPQRGRTRERFKLTVGHSWYRYGSEPLVWEDSAEKDLESMLPEIVLELISMGERQYHGHREYQYRNLVDRKAKLEEKEKERIET